jgi:hypothetical protein
VDNSSSGRLFTIILAYLPFFTVAYMGHEIAKAKPPSHGCFRPQSRLGQKKPAIAGSLPRRAGTRRCAPMLGAQRQRPLKWPLDPVTKQLQNTPHPCEVWALSGWGWTPDQVRGDRWGAGVTVGGASCQTARGRLGLQVNPAFWPCFSSADSQLLRQPTKT